ncbi:hypothetical protein Tco_0097732 [Tanacetum coccineum]
MCLSIIINLTVFGDNFYILTLLPTCTCAAHEGTLKHNQLVRLMQFLMRLNDVYQPVRSNLLTMNPFLDVKDVFAIVSREDFHRGLGPGRSERERERE